MKKLVKKKLETSYVDTLEEELSREGVNFFTNEHIDKDYLILPRYLDTEATAEIGRYHHALTMQYTYVHSMLLKVEALLFEVEKELKKKKAVIFPTLDKKMSLQEKEICLYIHEDCISLLEMRDNLLEKANLVRGIMDDIELNRVNVSREITRRIGDNNAFGRNESVQKR